MTYLFTTAAHPPRLMKEEHSVTSVRQETLLADSDRSNLLADFFRQSLAISQVEFRKLFRDPTEIFSRAVQPILWLVVFGQVFSRVRGITSGDMRYEDFM